MLYVKGSGGGRFGPRNKSMFDAEGEFGKNRLRFKH